MAGQLLPDDLWDEIADLFPVHTGSRPKAAATPSPTAWS